MKTNFTIENGMNGLTEHIEKMTFGELKIVCQTVTEMYLKYDGMYDNEMNETGEHNETLFNVAEYFRQQIDITENYAINKFDKSTFDK